MLSKIYPLVFHILLYKSLMVVVVVGVGDKWIYLFPGWRMPQLGCALVNYSDMGGVSSCFLHSDFVENLGRRTIHHGLRIKISLIYAVRVD